MNIYVSNLNFSTKSESLQDLFAGFGEVDSAKVITDRDSGRSRGFGFVEMPNDDEAQEAIANLDQKSIKDRSISVSEARPPQPKERRPFRPSNRDSNDRFKRRY